MYFVADLNIRGVYSVSQKCHKFNLE